VTDVQTHYRHTKASGTIAERILEHLLANGPVTGRTAKRWVPASVVLAGELHPGELIHTKSDGSPESGAAYTRYHYVMAALQELVEADMVILGYETSKEINRIELR
jgi:hypothetical protein